MCICRKKMVLKQGKQSLFLQGIARRNHKFTSHRRLSPVLLTSVKLSILGPGCCSQISGCSNQTSNASFQTGQLVELHVPHTKMDLFQDLEFKAVGEDAHMMPFINDQQLEWSLHRQCSNQRAFKKLYHKSKKVTCLQMSCQYCTPQKRQCCQESLKAKDK